MTTIRSSGRGRVPPRLRVYMSGEPAGWLSRDGHGRVILRYDAAYAERPVATPLSVGLPLTQEQHVGRHLDAWLANLLPDNDRVLGRWATHYQVSANSPYSLLAHVGVDCAGAVQFAPEERLDVLESGGLRRLSQDAVAQRLAALAIDPAAWTPMHEGGSSRWLGLRRRSRCAGTGDGGASPGGETRHRTY